METQQLNTTLNNLVGHLVIDTPEAKKNLERLSQSLTKSSLGTKLHRPIKKEFTFEKSDLFFENRIAVNQKKVIADIIKNRVTVADKLQYKVFRREAPIREHLLHNSIADWAVGAKVDHSIGPFKSKDGRQFWYDFFPIERLISLYMQGEASPVLLFKVKTGLPISRRTVGGRTLKLIKSYTLTKGSIWILSKFIAPNAPAGSYTGLTIKDGKITLSTKPKTINKKLTITAATTISVHLNLDQQKVTDSDDTSPYGKDARELEFQLPEILKFHFNGIGRTIDLAGNANSKLYGQKMSLSWNKAQQTTYDPLLQRIFFPYTTSEPSLVIKNNASDFNTLKGETLIGRNGWVLSAAIIDTSQPLAAEGIGQIFIQCKEGLSDSWQGLQAGGLNLTAPSFIISPGQIFLMDLLAGNAHANQSLELWQDELNPFGTKATLRFSDQTPFFYASNANGNELLMTFTNANLQIDRPVRVNGEPPEVRSLNSLLLIGVSKTNKLIYLMDNNLVLDDAEIYNEYPIIPERMAFALTNALLKVVQPNGCLLFGSLSDDFEKIEKGFLFLTFGLLAYIPTLPDPYAANLGILRKQIRGKDVKLVTEKGTISAQHFTAWLVSRIAWDLPTANSKNDSVDVSFHFAPLNNPFVDVSLPDIEERVEREEGDSRVTSSLIEEAPLTSSNPNINSNNLSNPISRLGAFHNPESIGRISTHTTNIKGVSENIKVANATTSERAIFNPDIPELPNYEEQWDKEISRFRRDLFALLDVSTNADLFGVSFDLLTRKDFRVTTNVDVTTGEATSSFFPVQVDGMDVVSAGANVKAFIVPQISWEPVFNLSPPAPPPDGPLPGDPQGGFNYYPNDGGPSHIINNSEKRVALAPLPVVAFLVKNREEDEKFRALSFFTLPFGIRAVASLEEKYSAGTDKRGGGDINRDEIFFEEDIKGGLQLILDAGMPLNQGDSNMFMGTTVQVNNILDLFGNSTGTSTLGDSVTRIFNEEFFNPPPGPFNLLKQRGVPVTRMDMSGYGASMLSNWLNSKAALAQTSQSKFDVFVGRCSHEVIQVKSVVYPWGIKVVRTITLFRVGSGYVYRVDSGWRAESDGKFDLRYFVTKETDPAPRPAYPRMAPYEIHPGLVSALYNVTNILETAEIEPFKTEMIIKNDEIFVNEDGAEVINETGVDKKLNVFMRAVYFDADINIEGVTSGAVKKNTSDGKKEVVPSKRVLGFVQLAPKGQPLSNDILKILIARQGNIGGSIDCEVNLAESTQKMRLSRFDFNNSFLKIGMDPIYSVAGRGNVLLPRDGSWSMVKHDRSSGDVSPVPSNLSVPVIREGKVVEQGDTVEVQVPPGGTLTRIAEPTELLRDPVDSTVNYGFLQSTDTQKALFLTPSFKKGTKKLLSKTPPLFVDAFRIVNSKGIFPNIGDADNFSGDTVGEAVLMKKGGNIDFPTSNLKDLGKDVFELMDIQDTIDSVKQQGLKLIHNPEEFFDLPTEFELIDLGDGNFRIYIEYAKKDKDNNVQEKGNLAFDIDSVAKSWKSKMNNIGLVIDLAGIKRLMTIRGNWDSKNGEEASYPKPDLQFSSELQPLVDLLEILQSLQSGDYGDAIGKGLKLAMSNKAGSWEYKFEASKEIPVLRFPVPDAVYNDPNTPFKLECGLTLSAYFNAALKVTTDANELLPSAGASLGFYARLSVMCVSVSAATIYAIGQANVDIGADTKIGPSLRMKFGFGAQIVIGLPVAGNVSVLFVVGAEIFIADGIIEISAFMLFVGHAEILGGIVSITIRIEAKGTYTKKAIGTGSRTDMECQVTFGLDISIAFIINISFTESWSEQRQIA